MKLAKLNNQSAEYKNLRNKVIFQIQGTEDDAALIERLDIAIGSTVYGANGAGKDITWKQECSDDCAEYSWGTGCSWIVDKDDVDDFKALWKKFKKAIK